MSKELFYIDTQPHHENMIETESYLVTGMNSSICQEKDRELVSEIITQLMPLSAPMKELEEPTLYCRNNYQEGTCCNPECQTMLNVRWGHRSSQYIIKVRCRQIYYCCLACAQNHRQPLRDLKLGIHLTIPKSIRLIIYFLQNNFCCRLHMFKFYESICIINFLVLKNSAHRYISDQTWSNVLNQLMRLNLSCLTDLLGSCEHPSSLVDHVNDQQPNKKQKINHIK
jgi:hypothetical protein